MNSKPLAMCLHRDSSEKERTSRLEAALRRSEKLAMAGTFAASVMHEINNPSQAIGDLVYLIAKDADRPDLVRARAAQIEEQLARIQHISRQTLSFFRDSPLAQVNDLVQLVDTALRYQTGLIQEKQIRLIKRLPETLLARIYPGDLLQLISNLVRNAVEAMPSGGTLHVRLRTQRTSHGTVARLVIADNGHGIPATIKNHLFEAFHSDKAEAGNGLGLWICKNIAEKHGGEIRCRSRSTGPTRGTTFVVTLPIEGAQPLPLFRPAVSA